MATQLSGTNKRSAGPMDYACGDAAHAVGPKRTKPAFAVLASSQVSFSKPITYEAIMSEYPFVATKSKIVNM